MLLYNGSRDTSLVVHNFHNDAEVSATRHIPLASLPRHMCEYLFSYYCHFCHLTLNHHLDRACLSLADRKNVELSCDIMTLSTRGRNVLHRVRRLFTSDLRHQGRAIDLLV